MISASVNLSAGIRENFKSPNHRIRPLITYSLNGRTPWLFFPLSHGIAFPTYFCYLTLLPWEDIRILWPSPVFGRFWQICITFYSTQWHENLDNEGPRFSELGTQISQRSSLFHYWEDGKSLRRSDANADCTRDVHVKQKSAAILDENRIIQKIVTKWLHFQIERRLRGATITDRRR